MNEEKTEKKSFFAQIPSVVLCDSRLSSTAKLVYGEIFALANEKGSCYPSNAYLAAMLGITPRQISQCISALKQLELIEYETPNNNSRVIMISLRGIEQNFIGDRRKLHRGMKKTSYHSIEKNIEKNSIEKESIKEKVEDYFLDVPEHDVEELSLKFNVSPSTVINTAEKIHDYILSTGRHYHDAKATLRGWLRRDLEKTQRKEIPVFADLYGDNPPELNEP